METWSDICTFTKEKLFAALLDQLLDSYLVPTTSVPHTDWFSSFLL